MDCIISLCIGYFSSLSFSAINLQNQDIIIIIVRMTELPNNTFLVMLFWIFSLSKTFDSIRQVKKHCPLQMNSVIPSSILVFYLFVEYYRSM